MNETTEYQGHEITHDPKSRAVCAYFVRPVRLYARDLETAKRYIDAYLERQANPPAGVRIVSFETRCPGMRTAGKHRQAQDRADAQRTTGKRGQFGKVPA